MGFLGTARQGYFVLILYLDLLYLSPATTHDVTGTAALIPGSFSLRAPDRLSCRLIPPPKLDAV